MHEGTEQALTRDRVFEVAANRNGRRDLYYVVAYSNMDAVMSVVQKMQSEPAPEGWNIKDFLFTAESQ